VWLRTPRSALALFVGRLGRTRTARQTAARFALRFPARERRGDGRTTRSTGGANAMAGNRSLPRSWCRAKRGALRVVEGDRATHENALFPGSRPHSVSDRTAARPRRIPRRHGPARLCRALDARRSACGKRPVCRLDALRVPADAQRPNGRPVDWIVEVGRGARSRPARRAPQRPLAVSSVSRPRRPRSPSLLGSPGRERQSLAGRCELRAGRVSSGGCGTVIPSALAP
jgi:hypothetical protein